MMKKLIILLALLLLVIVAVVVLGPSGPGDDVQDSGVTAADRAAMAAATAPDPSADDATAGTDAAVKEPASDDTGKTAEPVAVAPVEAKPVSVPLGNLSTVEFTGYSTVHNQKCSFLFVDGEMTLVGDSLAGGSLDVTIDTEEIDCEDDSFEGVAKKYFLDYENHPEASFASKAILAKEGSTCRVIGDLTIKEFTKEIAFNAEVTNIDGKVVFDSEVKLDRKEFKVAFEGKGNYLISDEFSIKLHLVGTVK